MTQPVGAPYPGLAPYSEADAPFFFGREMQRRLVVANMESEPLTILYGPSGVGKTSFLQAGVLRHFRELARHHLDAGDAPGLAALIFRSWRDNPVASLRDAAIEAVGEALSRTPPSSPPDGLAETTSWAANAVKGSLYVILDQFEDYFLYWPDEDDGFFAEFPAAVRSAVDRVSFLLSIREDALAKLDRFKGRIPGLFANYMRLDHLDREQGREAIERPLQVLNTTSPERILVEPELVEAVLDAVQMGSASLGSTPDGGSRRIEAPYLQVVLNRIWNEELARGSKVLRLDTLEMLGGAERIVRTHLGAAMNALSPDEQEIASEVMRFLVTRSGARVAYTASDLADFVARPPDEVLVVLERLAAENTRILRAIPGPQGETRYEVFSDLLAPSLLDWRAHLGQAHTDSLLAQERRRVRQLRLAVIALTAIAAVLVILAIWALS